MQPDSSRSAEVSASQAGRRVGQPAAAEALDTLGFRLDIVETRPVCRFEPVECALHAFGRGEVTQCTVAIRKDFHTCPAGGVIDEEVLLG